MNVEVILFMSLLTGKVVPTLMLSTRPVEVTSVLTSLHLLPTALTKSADLQVI